MNTIKLGEIAILKGGKRLPKGHMLSNYENKHPYIKITNIVGKRIVEKNKEFEYLEEATFEKISRYIVEKGDLIISNVGTIGNVAIIGETLHKANLTENCVNIKYDKEKLYLYYLYYFLISYKGQAEITKGIVGTTQPKLPIYSIENIDIKVPSIEKQREIACRISVYDDKIENNNKIINTLEEMASLLYKRYFVDFEFPNDEGKPYKSNGGQFIDSELGLIPTGWEKKDAKELIDFITGFEPGASAYIDKKLEDCVQFFRVKDLSEKQEIYIKKDIIKKSNNVNKNDVLVSFDGTIGRVAIGYEGCYSSGMKKLISKNSDITDAYIYFYMKSEKTQNTLKEHATGTIILHASKSIDYLNVLYSKCTMEKFNTLVKQMYEMILNKKEENELLFRTRDLLIKELIK